MFGRSKNSEIPSNQSTFFHEDFSIKEVNEATVGRKGESLFYLKSLDVPIPDFFVISPSVYRNFMLGAFEKKLANLLEKMKDPDIYELEKIILASGFGDAIQSEIEQNYSRLSGFSNAWVAVRSSVVYPQDKSVTFSGIFHTELSVKGSDQLLEAIKHVYLSVFKNRVLLYANEKNVDLADLQMGIVVQRMVQPEVAGITYTQDPITKDKKFLSVEAVFGLGDVITDGSITPDLYTLDKKDLSLVEKHISPQDWMRIRKPADNKIGVGDPFQKIQISKTWSHQQKLEDNYVQDIAKVCLIVEDKAKSPQMIEWAWESGNVWVLQNKSLVESEITESTSTQASSDIDSLYDVALLMVKEDQQKKKGPESKAIADKVLSDGMNGSENAPDPDLKKGDEDIAMMEEKIEKMDSKRSAKEKEAIDKKILKDKSERAQLGIPDVGEDLPMEFLLSGIGVSTGKITGRITYIDEKTTTDQPITKRDILLITKFKQEMEPMLIKSAGVITDEGGLTSDLAILCREIGIPAVTGTGLASTLLKDGEFVMIDGNVGSVYRYTSDEEKVEEKESTPKDSNKDNSNKIEEKIPVAVATQLKEKTNESETAAKTDEKDEKLDIKDKSPLQPKLPTATKVFLYPKPGTKATQYEDLVSQFDGIFFVELDSLILENGRHPGDYLKEKKFQAYSKELELILDGFADLDPGNEVVVSIGSATAGELRSLTKGSVYEPKENSDMLFGAQRLLSDKALLDKYLDIIKKVRNVYKNRNISIAIHGPVNKNVLSEVKSELSKIGLKRTGTFNLYAVIDSSSDVILVDEIISTGIDGLIVNTPQLAMQMQGLSRNSENAKYNIDTTSVWTVLESLVSKAKSNSIRTVVVTEGSSKLTKKCVQHGVYGVSLYPEKVTKMRKEISEEETRIIMSID